MKKFVSMNFQTNNKLLSVLLFLFLFAKDSNAAIKMHCSLDTPAQWQTFLNTVVNNPKWVNTCEDSVCDEKFYSYVISRVQDTLTACEPYLAAHPNTNACVERLKRFTPSWLRQHDFTSYGFNVDNEHYLADQESAHRPAGMMLVPPEIIEALPDRKKVEEVARLHGWLYLSHDSGLGGSRTFVILRDPQDRYDTWLLLNLRDGNKQIKNGQPLSMITVQKRDADGKKLEKVQLHFRDYTLESHGSDFHLALYPTNNGKCYSCHSNGVRQLIMRRTPILDAKPVRGENGFNEKGETQEKDFAYKRLMEFNRRLRSYGRPDWEGKITPENFGPALGEAQRCTECHNGTVRSALSVAFSHAQVKQKVVSELMMPLNSSFAKLLEKEMTGKMSSSEKAALESARATRKQIFADFESSRFPTLKKWLLEIPCK